jgi:DNA invertase Pin-like site-specific DNA recombinase
MTAAPAGTVVALYARVSTGGQDTRNQLQALRRYAASRQWTIGETYVDHGISGSRSTRPALDRLMKDAQAGEFSSVLVWKLDRFGRSLPHLLSSLERLRSYGVSFYSMTEGFDVSTASGKLQMHILGACAEFERALTVERIHAGLQRTKAEGTTLGRPRQVSEKDYARVAHLSLSQAAKALGVSSKTIYRYRAATR